MLSRSRTLIVLAALGAAYVLPGCSVYKYARLTAIREPAVYNRKTDRVASLIKYRSLAEDVWTSGGMECPGEHGLDDFKAGFREGFAEYVYAGGDGTPPPVPPRVYWRLGMRSVEGAAAAQSWFAGYRFGAQVAREGGYRQVATVTVSASVRDCTPCGCPGEELGARSQITPSPIRLINPINPEVIEAVPRPADTPPTPRPVRQSPDELLPQKLPEPSEEQTKSSRVVPVKQPVGKEEPLAAPQQVLDPSGIAAQEPAVVACLRKPPRVIRQDRQVTPTVSTDSTIRVKVDGPGEPEARATAAAIPRQLPGPEEGSSLVVKAYGNGRPAESITKRGSKHWSAPLFAR